MPRKAAQDGTRAWAPSTHVVDQDAVLGFLASAWPNPGFFSGVNRWIEDVSPTLHKFAFQVNEL